MNEAHGGVLDPKGRVTSRVRAAAMLSGVWPSKDEGAADFTIALDDPPLDTESFRGEGLAVIVSSASAFGLAGASSGGGDGAFARAVRWAGAHREAPAPPTTPERMRELTRMAEAAGFRLVEPDVAHTAKAPIDRAIFWTVAHGALSRPLLFVPARRAPKGGLAKVRPSLDLWIEARALDVREPSSLADAAFGALHDGGKRLHGSELLRAARQRWGRAASAEDGKVLAKALLVAWMQGAVDLYPFNPA